MKVSCFTNQVIDYHANLVELFVTQERNFPFAPSQGTQNVVLLCCSCLRAYVCISGSF